MTREELEIEYEKELKDCFSFSPSKGWLPMVAGLLANIRALSIEGLSIVQVKSKFGGLRFYIHGGDERTDVLISDAERKSLSMCENCGAEAGDGEFKYGMNLCKKHTENKDRRKY